MADDSVAMFCAITATEPQKAQQYLQLTDGNVEQAVELFFSNPDLGGPPPPAPAPAPAQSTSNNPITIDDDDDDDDDDDNMLDDDVQVTGSGPAGGATYEDDEAMARRLQQEMYGGGGGGAAGAVDEDGVRAPIARTTETLVGPGSDWRDDPHGMNAAIAEQLMNRHRNRNAPAGIFNQQPQSIWNSDPASSAASSTANNNPEEAHQRALSRATGGASDTTTKSNHLAELFRPPFDLISPIPTWTAVRDEGKDSQKWILVNIQDPSIFDCQVLNRDIWKNPSIRDTVKEHFLFLQYNKGDHRGQEYINYYFSANRDNEAAYPHIGIVDPRTGEQVKTWSGSPAPKANEFLMDLHEFLDRYSLDMGMKNPVQGKRKEKRKEVGQMSEEEMLEMALANSLENGKGVNNNDDDDDDDPDALTREEKPTTAQQQPEPAATDAPSSSNGHPPSAFSLIPSTSPHQEPPANSDVTRIQFRHRGGRVVRRFALSDPVRRIYEWLKAEPLDAAYAGKDFELICLGKNLVGELETSIEAAGLKNGTVMVEVGE